MSGQLSNYGLQYVAQVLFGQAIPPAPLYYIALTNLPPTPASDGTNLDEPTAADYQRATIQNDTDHWTQSGYSTMFNSQIIQFPIPTTDWGLVKYYALLDDLQEGNVIASGLLKQAQTIVTGDQPRLLLGTVSFSVDISAPGVV